MTGEYGLRIAADQAVVIVLPPAAKPSQHRGRQLCIDGVTVDFGGERLPDGRAEEPRRRLRRARNNRRKKGFLATDGHG